MPPIDDKDREEIKGIISKLFGVPDGKTVAETLAEQNEGQFNTILNKYDKKAGKEREALTTQLNGLSDTLKELKDAKPPVDDAVKDSDADAKNGKDSAEVKNLQNELRKLNEKLEVASKATAEEKAAREKLETQTAHRTMLEAVRTKALGKEIGVDPEKIGFLLDHLDHNGAVRMNEGKTGYEISVGKDKSGEPIWDTLDDGLPKLVKSGPGAFFLPAVKGAGGGQGGGGGKPGIGSGGGAEPTTSIGLIAEGLRKRAAAGQ